MELSHQIKTDNKITIEDLETTEFQNSIRDLNDKEIADIVGGVAPECPHWPRPCNC
jgi:hypothetical protein